MTCLHCQKPFAGRKGQKFCFRKSCIADRNRKYVRESYARKKYAPKKDPYGHDRGPKSEPAQDLDSPLPPSKVIVQSWSNFRIFAELYRLDKIIARQRCAK